MAKYLRTPRLTFSPGASLSIGSGGFATGWLVSISATMSPAAKDLDLARQMGVNRGEVSSNRKSYEFSKTARDIDALKTSAPKLRTWLDEARENLEIAHDDTENLGWWEQVQGALNPGSLSIEEVGRALRTGAVEGGQQQFFGAVEMGIASAWPRSSERSRNTTWRAQSRSLRKTARISATTFRLGRLLNSTKLRAEALA